VSEQKHTHTYDSQLALSQCRDDPRFNESRVRPVSDNMKQNYPIFCLRIELSRLAAQFCKCGAQALTTSSLLEMLEVVYHDITAFKESCPFEWRPDHDTFAEPEEHQHVLLMHMEYQALLLAVFTALGVMPFIMPDKVRYGKREARNQMIHCISNSRRTLQTLNDIANSAHVKPDLVRW
jgi:hypothetical protein